MPIYRLTKPLVVAPDEPSPYAARRVCREPQHLLCVTAPDRPLYYSGTDMRTFVAGTTKIDVIAHISQEGLELDRLVLSGFEGSETTANAAFQTLVERYGGKPLAEYALAPQEIDLPGEAVLQ